MKTYETSATVEEQGQIHVVGVRFAPGTEVEVSISAKRGSAAEFAAGWRRICTELRSRTDLQDISDEEIREEIDRNRAGQ